MDKGKKREIIKDELAEKCTVIPKSNHINAIFGGVAVILIVLMLYEIWIMFKPYLNA